MNTCIRLKEKFPKEIDLRGGLTATIRPMVATDEKALAEFFRRIPINERHLFKDDVTDGKVIEKWCRKIEYDRILPLLVICKDRIIADATLHRSGARAQSHVLSSIALLLSSFLICFFKFTQRQLHILKNESLCLRHTSLVG